MGIPRLFRLLVERYPLILRQSSDLPVPSFDNLYLDFNGIIHVCTHNNEEKLVKTKEQMIMSMFGFVENLVDLVKPSKVLYIAVDGVAPRAKMNQQRQRRFRTATVQEEGAFDSNCITPGTEFMQELDQHMLCFIQRKIEEDDMWKSLRVIYSGHRVPGEGEHKIMEFIRSYKSRPDYDPNTTHCLHGLDADLIMLALATHEPHFCILREKVMLRTSNALNDTDSRVIVYGQEQERQFLHIGLLREYIALEFQLALKAEDMATFASPSSTSAEKRDVDPDSPFFKADFDLERIVDDFVFLCFFVGNDFLPHLLTADLFEGGLDRILLIYRVISSQRRDYLVNAHHVAINFVFLEEILQKFGQVESAFFQKNIEAKQSKQKEPPEDNELVTLSSAGDSLPSSSSSDMKQATGDTTTHPPSVTPQQTPNVINQLFAQVGKVPHKDHAGPVPSVPQQEGNSAQNAILGALQAGKGSSTEESPSRSSVRRNSGPEHVGHHHAARQATGPYQVPPPHHPHGLPAVHGQSLPSGLNPFLPRQPMVPGAYVPLGGFVPFYPGHPPHPAMVQPYGTLRPGGPVPPFPQFPTHPQVFDSAHRPPAPNVSKSAPNPLLSMITASSEKQDEKNQKQSTKTPESLKMFLHPSELNRGKRITPVRKGDVILSHDHRIVFKQGVSKEDQTGEEVRFTDADEFRADDETYTEALPERLREPVVTNREENSLGADESQNEVKEVSVGTPSEDGPGPADPIFVQSASNQAQDGGTVLQSLFPKPPEHSSSSQGAPPSNVVTQSEQEKQMQQLNALFGKNALTSGPAVPTDDMAPTPALISNISPIDGTVPQPQPPSSSSLPATEKKLPPSEKVEEADAEDEADESSDPLSSAPAVSFKNLSSKAEYYTLSFGVAEVDEDILTDVCRKYVEGLFWTLHYYYQGPVSWSWYYPYHAAPLPSDVINIPYMCRSISLEMGAPLLPFQQLLAVLPPQSKHLLPPVIAALMEAELAPFYPRVYESLLDAKGRSWKHIALIPFIDEECLLEAYNKAVKNHEFTLQEAERNSLKVGRLVCYEPSAALPTTSLLPSLESGLSHCSVKNFVPWPLEGPFKPRLVEGCVLPHPAMPSFSFLPHSKVLKCVGVDVLYSPSKNDSLCILPAKKEVTSILGLASELLDSVVHAHYPYPLEGKVVGVIDMEKTFRGSKKGRVVDTPTDKDWWTHSVNGMKNRYLRKKAIYTDSISVLVELHMLKGVEETPEKQRQCVFASSSVFVPLQLIIRDKVPLDARYAPRPALDVSLRFKTGLKVVYLGERHYSSLAHIRSTKTAPSPPHHTCSLHFLPAISPNAEQNIIAAASKIAFRKEKYMSQESVASSLSIHPLVLSRLAGSVIVSIREPALIKVHIGLCFKFSRKGLMLAGYSRRHAHPRREGSFIWEFSEKGVQAIKEFLESFPDLFRGVDACSKQDEIGLEDLFLDEEKHPLANPRERFAELQSYLEAQPWFGHPLIPCDCLSLSSAAIRELEAEVQRYVATGKSDGGDLKGVTPMEMLLPIDCPLSESKQDVEWGVGQRVINLRSSGVVPFGLKGVIVSIYQGHAEVLFDAPFLAATNLHDRCVGFKGATVPLWSLLNITLRQRMVSSSAILKAQGKEEPAKKVATAKDKSKREVSNPFSVLMP